MRWYFKKFAMQDLKKFKVAVFKKIFKIQKTGLQIPSDHALQFRGSLHVLYMYMYSIVRGCMSKLSNLY